MKVEDLIRENVDIDVYDDYDERCACAVCGPIKLTEAGKSVFGTVLEMSCDIYDFKHNPYGYHAVVHCDDEYHAEALKNFLLAAAGYVSDDLYKKWFMEV